MTVGTATAAQSSSAVGMTNSRVMGVALTSAAMTTASTVSRIWPSEVPGASSLKTIVRTVANEFTLSQDAKLTGIWFYSGVGSLSIPTASVIYDVVSKSVVTGTENDAPSWSGAAASGWIKCTYDGSVTLSANTRYKVAVLTAYWSSQNVYWTSGNGHAGITSGPIFAYPSTQATEGQSSGSADVLLAYPTVDGVGHNYWVDVEVTTTSAGTNATGGVIETQSQAGTASAAHTAPSVGVGES